MQTTSPMTPTQESRVTEWVVAPGRVRKLRIGPGARVLHVREGPLWLTTLGTRGAQPADLWLAAGDDCLLPAGADVVVEGWPRASFQLLVPPQDCGGALGALRRRLSGVWRRQR
jgi:hypothetical protein